MRRDMEKKGKKDEKREKKGEKMRWRKDNIRR